MKRGILIACIIIIGVHSAIAQRGLYFSPVFRNGISSSDQVNLTPLQHVANPVYTYGAELGVGYSFNKLRVQAGAGYQRSGYNYNMGANKTSYYFNHLTGTLQLGYVLRNNKRLAIVPYLGASYAFNYGSRSVSKLLDGSILKKRLDQTTFKKQFNPSSILGHAKLHFEYRFAQNAALIFGPSFQYMITDMSNSNVILAGNTELKNHIAFLDLGIIWILPDRSKSGKNRMPSLFYN
ncbi:MAG: outer membrane beta-barrel protein [Flavipsychrobacter sp.]